MAENTHDGALPPTSGAEKRAFTRNSIFLVGECVSPGQPDRTVEILDFCPGGVFVSFPLPPIPIPERGQILEIRCSVPGSSGVRSLHFQGRVARANQSGSGIAFINPSFEALQILHEYAKSASSEHARASRKKQGGTVVPGAIDASTEALLNACAQAIEAQLEPISKAFLSQATDHFFRLAGEARNIAEKNSFYAASNSIAKDGVVFAHEFVTLMKKRLARKPLLDSVEKKNDASVGGSGPLTLSLVEDDAFEDWLSFTDMAHSVEIDHKEELSALERRLGAVFQQPVNKENNPFGPGTISHIFQEALGILAFDRRISSESCKVFKNALGDQAGALYAELNRILVDGGVLPVLRPAGMQPKKPSHSPRKSEEARSLSPETSAAPHPETSITGLTPPAHSPDLVHTPVATQADTPFPSILPDGGMPSASSATGIQQPAATSQGSTPFPSIMSGAGVPASGAPVSGSSVQAPGGVQAAAPLPTIMPGGATASVSTPSSGSDRQQSPASPQAATPLPTIMPGGGTVAPDASFSSLQQPAGAPAVAQQSSLDWYNLMQGLGQLQQQLAVSAPPVGGRAQAQHMQMPAEAQAAFPSLASGQADATASAPSQPPVATQHYTTDELLSALSRIREEISGKSPGENFHQGFMQSLHTALADAAPSTEVKEVPSRETNILQIGGNLFDSVLTDKLVADTVKPWLNQLSIPLIKLALRDDSMFYDRSHLARQLINQIAQLELFSSASKVENAVRKKIDGLLSDISGADEVTPDLLKKMLKEVGLLVHVQNKAYEGNIRDLIASCESEEQRLMLEKPVPKTSALGKLMAGLQNLTGDDASVPKDEVLEEFKKRARRLKVGNWLMLGHGELQKRIRLAWVTKNLDKFVFVNLLGLREETLSQQDLAQFLRDGEAVVLDDGGEQLVDRAQSSMLQRMHHQLLHESAHDQLTGLINRREFEKRLAETLARVHESGMASVLCYFDLEQFSVVNNTFGYEGGDRALVEVARLLKQELDEDGLLARIGGDEFAMLIENCSLEDALRMTSRHTAAFRAYRFTSGDKSLSLSFSAGMVAIGPESEGIENLMQAAEASCRIARTKGTNYVQVYRPDESNLARHLSTVKWVSRIDEALDKSTFELRCQPIVSVAGSKIAIHHSEVLLRVPDGTGKMISPVDLIMAAENFRRMSSVDRWVIKHAFKWMADRKERINELGGLAINLSGASLNEEGLIDFVLAQAEKMKIPMNKICFEITETVGVSHLSSASEFISELKKKSGCTFSLDDFGSGQSSYAYLKNLPVDFLKIDGAFVEKMDQNPYDFAVVKSITEVGHFMGKKIIAERVENEAVLKMLRQIGVDYAQGYYLGKPRDMKVLGA